MVKLQINLANMKKLIDFLKSGDKIWHIIYGWCTIYSIEFNMAYPIRVQLPYQIDTDDYKSFLADGREHQDTVQPSLFLHEVTLKQEPPEFVEGEIVCAKREKYCDVYDFYYDEWVLAIYKRHDKPTNTYICKNLDKQLDFVFDAVKSLNDSYFAK
jgi:hypothetical protein